MRDGHRVIDDGYRVPVQPDAQSPLYFVPREEGVLNQMVQRWAARRMHAPRLLAHTDDALTGYFSGGEVNVAQLGQCVAHGIINRAQAQVSALNVRHGNS